MQQRYIKYQEQAGFLWDAFTSGKAKQKFKKSQDEIESEFNKDLIMVRKGAEKSKNIVRKFDKKKSKVNGKNINNNEIEEESVDSKGS